MTRRRLTRALPVTLAFGLMMSMTVAGAVQGSGGGGPAHGFLTDADPYITLTDPGEVTPIMTVGDEIGDFTFEGIPDGIGLTRGDKHGTVDVYVAHEQSEVPFPPLSGAIGPPRTDFQDASVSKLTLSKYNSSVLDASVAISPDEGYIRFCSAFMATEHDGFRHPTFFVGEESNDILDVPAGAAYGPDPGIAPQRQAGYVVAYDTVTETATPIPGMGRLNHENNIVVPGGWRKTAILTTDDTFDGPSAQLYMYLAGNDKKVIKDRGHLWAFQVTHKNGTRVKRNDPFNNANDYLDIKPGDDMQGPVHPGSRRHRRRYDGRRTPDGARELVEREQRVPVHPPRGSGDRPARQACGVHRRHWAKPSRSRRRDRAARPRSERHGRSGRQRIDVPDGVQQAQPEAGRQLHRAGPG